MDLTYKLFDQDERDRQAMGMFGAKDKSNATQSSSPDHNTTNS